MKVWQDSRDVQSPAAVHIGRPVCRKFPSSLLLKAAPGAGSRAHSHAPSVGSRRRTRPFMRGYDDSVMSTCRLRCSLLEGSRHQWASIRHEWWCHYDLLAVLGRHLPAETLLTARVQAAQLVQAALGHMQARMRGDALHAKDVPAVVQAHAMRARLLLEAHRALPRPLRVGGTAQWPCSATVTLRAA